MKTILRKTIIFSVVCITVALVLLTGVFVLLANMKTKMAKVADSKERLASYQKNKKAFQEETNQIRALGQRLSTLESYVVKSETVPALLSTLETLATKNNVGFEITSVQTPIENEKTKLLIDCTAKGSFTQVQSFFAQLQQQPFQVRFTKLFFFSEEGEKSLPEVSGTLSVKKTKSIPVAKELQWQGVATIEIVSF